MTIDITLNKKKFLREDFRSRAEYAFLVIYIFLYLFFPPVVKLNTLYFLAAVSYFYFFTHIKKAEKYFFNVYTGIIFAGLGIMLLYVFVVSRLSGMLDADVVRDFFYYLCLFVPICMYIIAKFDSMNFSYDDIIKILLVVGNVQGLLCIISLVFPPFHDFVLARLVNYGFDETRYSNLSKYRLYGFAFHMTNYMPMVLAVLSVIAIYRARKEGYYIKYVPLLILGVFFNSRSSILLIALGIGLIALFSVKNAKLFLKIMAIVMAIGIVGVIVFKLFIMTSDSWFAGWIRTGFESVGNLMGGQKTNYFSYISDEGVWELPKGLSLILGKGTKRGTLLNMSFSDVGFINYIRIGGIIYMIMLVAFLLIMIHPFLKRDFFIYVFIIATFIVMNIKDTLFSGNEFMCLIFLLCFIAKHREKDSTMHSFRNLIVQLLK